MASFEAASEEFYANLDIKTAFETYRELLHGDVKENQSCSHFGTNFPPNSHFRERIYKGVEKALK